MKDLSRTFLNEDFVFRTIATVVFINISKTLQGPYNSKRRFFQHFKDLTEMTKSEDFLKIIISDYIGVLFESFLENNRYN